jgi:hypothetical protein
LDPPKPQKGSLISDECVLKRPADLEKSSISTFLERKQMSTKTSIKRIALVAVSALGFGLLSVMPANAADVATTVSYTNTADAASNDGGTSAPYPQGSAISMAVTFTNAGAMESGDIISTTFAVTDPLGTVITSAATFTTSDAQKAAVVVVDGQAAAAAITNGFTLTASGAVDAAAYIVGTITIPATATTVAGSYSVVSTTTFTDSGDGSPSTNTDVDATNTIRVSGTSVTQGVTRGKSGSAQTGNVAAVTFFTPTHTASSAYRIVSSGVGSISGITQGAGTATSINPVSGVAGNWTQGGIYTTAAATTTESAVVSLASTEAGTQTITVYTVDATTGLLTARATSSVVWGGAQVVSGSTTTAYLSAGTDCAAAADTEPVRIVKTAGAAAAQATICITAKDGSGVAVNGAAVSATISGPGLIDLASGTTSTTGDKRADALTAVTQSATNASILSITADGTAGTATITVTVGAYTFTRTVYFYGTVATLTATQQLKIGRAGSLGYTLGCALNACTQLGNPSSQTEGYAAVLVVAKDADGNVVPGLTISAESSDTTVIGGATIVESTGPTTSTTQAGKGPGTYLVSIQTAPNGVSGKTATVTFKTTLSTGAVVSSSPVTFSLGGTRLGGTETMTLDKTTYAPGEKMVLTYKAKDSSGNPVYDGTAAPAATSSKAVSGSLDGGYYLDGESVLGDDEALFAPALSGAFTLTAASGTATGATISVNGTVGDDASTAAATAAADAAAEAIDAANAATDAANLAAEAADAATVAAEEARDAADAATAAVEELATQVATLMAALKAQITTLANTVAKIAKKVKA